MQLCDLGRGRLLRVAAVARHRLTLLSRFAAKCGQFVASLELKKGITKFAKSEHLIKTSNVVLYNNRCCSNNFVMLDVHFPWFGYFPNAAASCRPL